MKRRAHRPLVLDTEERRARSEAWTRDTRARGDHYRRKTMSDCVFCPTNWKNLTILQGSDGKFAVIKPLDPVTHGHVLVISAEHTPSAAEDGENGLDAFRVAGELMYIAAQWVHNQAIEANIITSIGRNATQTVMHTHLHVIPRTPADGLHLPWTGQVKREDVGRKVPREV